MSVDNKSPFGKGLYVDVRDNNVEKALRLFKRKIAVDGILKEYRTRMEYEKPSTAKRRRKADAIRRWRRQQQTLDV